MATEHCIGVDWSNGCWLGVIFEDGEYEETAVRPKIKRFLEKYPQTERLLVDIPIGLFQEEDTAASGDELVRECDAKARDVLGVRHSSVFNPPAREAVEEATEGGTYESVKQTSERITGKGLQIQAYHLADAINEVDRLLRENEALLEESAGPCVIESHPEVCFRALNEGQLSFSKTSAPGLAERLDAMERYLERPGETLYEICTELRTKAEEYDEIDVDIDDVLDSLVLAVAGTADETELQRLPRKDPPKDELGLPMQMVYRAEEPLSTNSD